MSESELFLVSMAIAGLLGSNSERDWLSLFNKGLTVVCWALLFGRYVAFQIEAI